MNKLVKNPLLVFPVIVLIIIFYIAITLIFQYYSRYPQYTIENIDSTYFVKEYERNTTFLSSLRLNPPYFVTGNEKSILDTKDVFIYDYEIPLYDYVKESYVFSGINCNIVFYNNQGLRSNMNLCEKNESISNISTTDFSFSKNYIIIYYNGEIYVFDRDGILTTSIEIAEGYTFVDANEIDGSLFYLQSTYQLERDDEDTNTKATFTLNKYDLKTNINTNVYVSSEISNSRLISGNDKLIFRTITEDSTEESTENRHQYYILDPKNDNLKDSYMFESKLNAFNTYYNNNSNYITLSTDTKIEIYEVTDKFTQTGTIDLDEYLDYKVIFSPKYIYLSDNNGIDIKQYNMQGQKVNTLKTNASEMKNNYSKNIYIYD